ncbi:MAG TPA: DUF4326 domain-containing protein [Bosea sp. (in: a-proteobacteria)]|jgi:hypothetical protein|nr:DUF4326 domain-containing protein [Bosea sp. (in: a-proteobacteria)]
MSTPVRLQLSRRKGFNLQALSKATNGLTVINVARPGRWGNPWSIRPPGWRGSWAVLGPGAPIGGVQCGNQEGAQLLAVKAFRTFAEAGPTQKHEPLRGKNLACWCKLGTPCHADVLIELANRPRCEAVG